jgi:20S proteasome alpha/beta subunit
VTLIVGIVCRDGIVVAADGAATLGIPELFTVRQPVKKLAILHDRIIVGASGPVGLGQRIIGQLGDGWQSGAFKNKPPHLVMTAMREAIYNGHIGMELQVAGNAKAALGAAAQASASSFTVVAAPSSGQACLFHFDRQGAPEQATSDLPFIAIGSGNIIADPFLAFLRRIFWQDEEPTVQDGIFAAVWTVDQAIKTNSGGVADPVQVCVLENGKGGWLARELADEELQEHRQAISEAEDRLRNYREVMTIDTPPSVPPAPN